MTIVPNQAHTTGRAYVNSAFCRDGWSADAATGSSEGIAGSDTLSGISIGCSGCGLSSTGSIIFGTGISNLGCVGSSDCLVVASGVVASKRPSPEPGGNWNDKLMLFVSIVVWVKLDRIFLLFKLGVSLFNYIFFGMLEIKTAFKKLINCWNCEIKNV